MSDSEYEIPNDDDVSPNDIRPEAELSGAELSEALLVETSFDDTVLSRGTEIGSPDDRIQEWGAERDDVSKEQQYDTTARANHELRQAYSGNGLISRAREARVRERKARRKEALAEDDWRGTLAYIGSVLSQVITGYGVRLRWVVGSMVALYLASAIVYWN